MAGMATVGAMNSAVQTESTTAVVLSRLGHLASSLASVEDRLQRISDLLWGGIPRDASAKIAAAPSQPGIFVAIQDLDDCVQRIQRELDRF